MLNCYGLYSVEHIDVKENSATLTNNLKAVGTEQKDLSITYTYSLTFIVSLQYCAVTVNSRNASNAVCLLVDREQKSFQIASDVNKVMCQISKNVQTIWPAREEVWQLLTWFEPYTDTFKPLKVDAVVVEYIIILLKWHIFCCIWIHLSFVIICNVSHCHSVYIHSRWKLLLCTV